LRHVQEVFSALERRVAAAGVDLYFALEKLFDRPNGEVGIFFPDRGGPGSCVIQIFRPRAVEVPGDLLFELLTLAHEFGHYRSFERGQRTPAYDRALAIFQKRIEGELDRTGRLLILEEERRAWRYGRAELEELGFCALEALDRRAEESLALYGKKMGA
jgi:hypothetical protein